MISTVKTPDSVLLRLAARWQRDSGHWVMGGESDFPMALPLSPPTEAEAGRHWPHFLAWVEAWRRSPLAEHVQWAERRWARFGAQSVPERVILPSAVALAAGLGSEVSDTFARARERARQWCEQWPALAGVVPALAGWLGASELREFERAQQVLAWMAAHAPVGAYLRELPLDGVDSKWCERNRSVLATALATILDRAPAPLEVLAGLRTDEPRRRLRLLDDALSEAIGGLNDVTVPLSALDALLGRLRPSAVLVVENLQTALACPALPGVVLVFGGGYAASELAEVPVLSRLPLFYWGDIDADGFAILSALRAGHPHARSILMDRDTWDAHRHLCVPDREGAPEPRLRLSGAEAEWVAQRPPGRLEQERVRWDYAIERLRVACARAP